MEGVHGTITAYNLIDFSPREGVIQDFKIVFESQPLKKPVT